MLVELYKDGRRSSYENKDEPCDYIEISFQNGPQNKRLKLLVILSPIFIAAFDSGETELKFLKDSIEKSSYSYGLYPKFFEGFDLDDYFKETDGKFLDDIYLKKNARVFFRINPLEDKYLRGLLAMIKGLILDDGACDELLSYFDNMRNDIVINGRRSILSNGVQAYYLRRYVVVWALDLIAYIENKNPGLKKDLGPIKGLLDLLKTPRSLR